MPDWFNNLKDILECLSYIVTIGGIIAIVVSIKELKKLIHSEEFGNIYKRDEEDDSYGRKSC